MNDWTRRQFGFFASAALLLPGVAAARKPASQAAEQSTKRRSGPLDLLSFTVALVEDQDHQVRYALTVKNDGPKGLPVVLGLAKAVTTPPIERSLPVAWLNGDHPLSRRQMPPPFQDVPAGDPFVLAHITMGVGREFRTPEMLLHTTLSVAHAESGAERRIELPPLPVVLAPTKQG